MFPGGQGRPDPIQVTGDLRYGAPKRQRGHDQREEQCPLTGLFPNLMAGNRT